ncbi:MAG: S1 RNA-binding domain-containing protein, partial [Pseudomonadales bacterium]
YAKGESIRGNIKSITDFGIFIGLEGGIDGLVHLSDISWSEPGETAIRRYTKGEEIETTVLSIDAERERISLGVKQLEHDSFSDYTAVNDKGAIVTGVIQSVEPKEAVILLAEDVTGILKASEISVDRVEDARNVLKAGDEVEVKIIGIDRKSHNIGLSVKAKEFADEREVVRDHQRAESARPGPTTIGDLIKAQMDRGEEPD